MGRSSSGALGTKRTWSTSWPMCSSPSGGDGDDLAGARGDFLDIGERFFVALDGVAVGVVFGGEDDDGERLVDEGVGAVLHLAGGVAFGVDVGNFLELERAFEGDGVVDAAAEEEEVAGVGVDAGEGLALGRRRCGGCLRPCRGGG